MRNSVLVVVADDHPLYRKGLVSALREDKGIDVLAEAASGDQALSHIREHCPDIAILDAVPRLWQRS